MKLADNSLRSVNQYLKDQLSELYPEREIQSMGRILLDFLFGYDVKYLSLNPDTQFNESELLQVIFKVKELKKGIPIQYVLGETEFMGLRFHVEPGVLIPRPETEELVNWIVKETSPASILDIGTGSGCIAIALKHLLPDSKVIGCDISDKALEIASKNAKDLSIEVDFQKVDILNIGKLKIEKQDVIVSNPPYVLQSEKASLHKNVVENEPKEALFVKDDDPLIFYNAITEFALSHLNKNGFLFFEINEAYGKEVASLLNEKGFRDVEIRKDLNGRDRMIRGRFDV